MTFKIEKHLGETVMWNFGKGNYRHAILVDGEKAFNQPGLSCGFIHFADANDPTKCLGCGGVNFVYNKLKAEGKITITMENRIFVKASKELADEAMAQARAWYEEENQTMFNDTRSTAVGAVAEYILNEKGFTLFDCNAKYPKTDS